MRAARLAREAGATQLSSCIESVIEHYEEKLSHLRDNYSMLEQVYLYGYAYKNSEIIWPSQNGGGTGYPSLPCQNLYDTVTDPATRKIIMDDVRSIVQDYQDTIRTLKSKMKTLLAISTNILNSHNYNSGI